MNILCLHIARGPLLDSEGVGWWVFALEQSVYGYGWLEYLELLLSKWSYNQR